MRLTAASGSAMLEFALTGVPLLFVILSLAGMTIAMWQYHTLAEAVNFTARVAAVHGAGCAGQTCATTVGSIAALFGASAIGIPANQVNVTLASAASTVTCDPLSSCYGNSAAWPSLAANTAVTTNISVTATLPMSGIWTFSPITAGAQSTQAVVF